MRNIEPKREFPYIDRTPAPERTFVESIAAFSEGARVPYQPARRQWKDNPTAEEERRENIMARFTNHGGPVGRNTAPNQAKGKVAIRTVDLITLARESRAFGPILQRMDSTLGQGGDLIKSGLSGQVYQDLPPLMQEQLLGLSIRTGDISSGMGTPDLATPDAVFVAEGGDAGDSDLATDIRNLGYHDSFTQGTVTTFRLGNQSSANLSIEVPSAHFKGQMQNISRRTFDGDATGTSDVQPDGLLNIAGIDETDGLGSATLSMITKALAALVGRDVDPRNIAMMVDPLLSERFLTTPNTTGGGDMMAKFHSDSPTGLVFKTSSGDGGVPMGVNGGLRTASDTLSNILMGDFSQSFWTFDSEVDYLIVKGQGPVDGPKGRTRYYSFLACDFTIERPEAFARITNA